MTSAQLKTMTTSELADEWWSQFSAYCRQHAVSRAWIGPLKTVPTV